MSILFVLVPLALMLGGGFLITFLFASAQGEFDDLETPAHRVLIDEEKIDL